MVIDPEPFGIGFDFVHAYGLCQAHGHQILRQLDTTAQSCQTDELFSKFSGMPQRQAGALFDDEGRIQNFADGREAVI